MFGNVGSAWWGWSSRSPVVAFCVARTMLCRWHVLHHSAIVTWFLTKGVGLVDAMTVWMTDGGCAMRNVGCSVDPLEEEGDYVTTRRLRDNFWLDKSNSRGLWHVASLIWSNLKVEECDTWELLVGQTVSARMIFSSGDFIHGHWLILMQGV